MLQRPKIAVDVVTFYLVRSGCCTPQKTLRETSHRLDPLHLVVNMIPAGRNPTACAFTAISPIDLPVISQHGHESLSLNRPRSIGGETGRRVRGIIPPPARHHRDRHQQAAVSWQVQLQAS